MLPSLGGQEIAMHWHGPMAAVGEKRGKVREVRRFGRKRSRLDVDDVEVGGQNKMEHKQKCEIMQRRDDRTYRSACWDFEFGGGG